MIEISGHYIYDDVEDIILELKKQLELNGIQRFHKTIRSGNNIQTCCPFHKDGQERKPSFGIQIKDSGKSKAGQCHCFTCGWTGSIQEMISNCFGYDDWGNFGSKWLVKNFLSTEVESRKDVELDLCRKSKHNRNVSSNYVTEAELSKYRYTHPYMYKRGLTDAIIDLFDIGYDATTDCITFPIRDINGNCVFVARRSVNSKFFQYPPNVEKPLYGLYELNGFKVSELIVCESMFDALSCWVYGKYAIALNGLGNELQIKQLQSLPCRKIILATDKDDAGMRARERLKKQIKGKIITEFNYNSYPEHAKDINDMSKNEFENLKEIF